MNTAKKIIPLTMKGFRSNIASQGKADSAVHSVLVNHRKRMSRLIWTLAAGTLLLVLNSVLITGIVQTAA